MDNLFTDEEIEYTESMIEKLVSVRRDETISDEVFEAMLYKLEEITFGWAWDESRTYGK